MKFIFDRIYPLQYEDRLHCFSYASEQICIDEPGGLLSRLWARI